jgi:hypothetical protein
MVSNADSDREIRTHRETYGGFAALMKWGTILSFIAAMIVVFIIAN